MSVFHGPGPPGATGSEVDSSSRSYANVMDNSNANRQEEVRSSPLWAVVSTNMKEYKLLSINFEKSTNYNVTEEEIGFQEVGSS